MRCPSFVFAFLLACSGVGVDGSTGLEGLQGPPGPKGDPGMDGKNGDNPNPSTPDQTGTRLKRYYSLTSAEDGSLYSEKTTRYRDTRLSIDCEFMTATDGKRRCLPSGETFEIAWVQTTNIFFEDSTCRIPIFTTDKRCKGTLNYLLVREKALPGMCSGDVPISVYAVKRAPMLPIIYQIVGASCISAGVASDGSYFGQSDIAKASPSDFVAGETRLMLLP